MRRRRRGCDGCRVGECQCPACAECGHDLGSDSVGPPDVGCGADVQELVERGEPGLVIRVGFGRRRGGGGSRLGIVAREAGRVDVGGKRGRCQRRHNPGGDLGRGVGVAELQREPVVGERLEACEPVSSGRRGGGAEDPDRGKDRGVDREDRVSSLNTGEHRGQCAVLSGQ